MNEHNLRYPIGEFVKPQNISEQNIKDWIEIINSFYEKLNTEVDELTKEQLQLKYRKEGWTIQQIVHHCADSHLNSFIRFKLALTENTPTIKPYHENLWAELPDTTETPIDWSLSLLYGLHKRWVHLLKNLSQEELKRKFSHPEHTELISLDVNIALYAWHCEHHLEHIRLAKKTELTD